MAQHSNDRRPVPPDLADAMRALARRWVNELGDPFPDGHYSTVGNPFLWEAETAFFAVWEHDGELDLS